MTNFAINLDGYLWSDALTETAVIDDDGYAVVGGSWIKADPARLKQEIRFRLAVLHAYYQLQGREARRMLAAADAVDDVTKHLGLSEAVRKKIAAAVLKTVEDFDSKENI